MRLKRILSVLLCVLLICSLAACSGGKNPETKPKTSDTPELSEYEKWQERMLSLCNMDYDGFIGYWDLRCDGFYGDDLTTALGILSGGGTPFLPLDGQNALIESTRKDYAERYGDDWRFSIKSISCDALPQSACEDFSAELKKVADSVDVLCTAADAWNDAGWSEFALDHGCSVADAKRLVEAYRSIGDACRSAEVTEALTVSVSLELSGSGTEPLAKEESFTVYVVNGRYVTEPLIDSSYALINLVY